jgi:hypothetical protein
MNTDSNFACLTYNAIGNEFTQYVISEDQLRNQLEFLAQQGFVVDGVVGVLGSMARAKSL